MNTINKPKVAAWCLYDWANSAYYAIIHTFVFAAYFTQKIAPNTVVGTQLWGYTNAIASVLIVLTCVPLGAIVDQTKHYRGWLTAFSLMGITATSLLWFAAPSPTYVTYTLSLILIATVTMEVAIVFYNAMLTVIAPPDYYGRISGWGWGLGYFGGLVSLLFCLVLFVRSPPAYLNTTNFEHIRIVGPFVGLWFFVFALPIFLMRNGTLTQETSLPFRQAVAIGLSNLKQTLKRLPAERNILVFLVAHMFYIDGLNSLFIFAGIFAGGIFHMSLDQILIYGITMNIAAGIGAIAFARINDRIGSKRTILIALSSMFVLLSLILRIHDTFYFWAVSFVLTLFVGPAQAASRTFMAHLTPLEQRNEYFGLFAFSGRITAFLGPWAIAYMTALWKSPRVGMSCILIFLFAGAAFLCFVKE
jgi:MFS transporter, UMF1 family